VKRVGYIVRNIKKVNGKEYEYFYLRRSDRVKSGIRGKYPDKQTILHSFGNRKKALSQLEVWKNNIEELPDSLKDWGYSLEDVMKWESEIESK